MMISIEGSVMSEFGRRLVPGTWAIGGIGPAGPQSASRLPCVSSVGRDTAYKDAKPVDQFFEVIPA